MIKALVILAVALIVCGLAIWYKIGVIDYVKKEQDEYLDR